MELAGRGWHQRDFGSLLGFYSKITPGGCPARGSAVPRSDAKVSGWLATVSFPFLTLASPIFLPLPPLPNFSGKKQLPSGSSPSPHSHPTPELGVSWLRTSWAAQGAVCSAVQSSQTLPACVKCNLLSRTKRLQTRVEFWQASGLVAK